MHQHRVVITGLGVLAPNGCGKEAFWQACLQGRSGVRAITRFDASVLPTRIAGDIPNFSPPAFGLTPAESTSLDRGTQFALAAANLALEDAGLNAPFSEAERKKIGVYIGTAMASVNEGEQIRLQLASTHLSGLASTNGKYTALIWSYMPSAAIAAHHRLYGPCLTLATGCSSGADALGQAFWDIQDGRAERMLAGGSDAALSQLGISVFNVMHSLSTRNDQPEQASRPYDALRDGFVLSEGAAVLLLEKREIALARGAHIYAEIVAFASNVNAYHMTTLPADGAPLQALLRQVMDEARLSPQQLGYINSHGSSTPMNDKAETVAYKAVLGQQAYHIPISSTKSLIGHTQGAASAIETLVTALALDRQILPPTINLEVADPQCDLDYVPQVARPLSPLQPLCLALTHSSGFGGVNSALVLARHETSRASSADLKSELASPESLVCSGPACLAQAHTYPPAHAQAHPPTHRVVITGLGAIASGGIGTAAYWQAIRAGQLSFEALTHSYDAVPWPLPVGKVKDFHSENYLDRKLAKRTDRMTHFALAAVQEALQDAQLVLDQEDPQRVGAVIANTLGGVESILREMEQFHMRGPRALSAHTAIAWLHVANVGQASIRHGFQGYCKTPLNDTAGGLNALGMAYHAIRRGVADILIAGGCEAPLHPYVLHVLDANLPICKETNPGAYRPFDLRANGVLVAEGAGICILEEYEHAQRRGARIYGELAGFAQTCAPQNTMLSSIPDPTAYTHAFQLVLDRAHLTPADIACVYLDGRAIPAWDASEAQALQEVFRSDFDTLPCSIPRTQFGHTLAAAGALDTICALLALQEGLVPPTLNCEEPDPHSCPPGLVRGKALSQPKQAQGALICARSWGGSHAILAVKKLKKEQAVL